MSIVGGSSSRVVIGAAQSWEKINENQKIPGSPPAWAIFKKNLTQIILKSGNKYYNKKVYNLLVYYIYTCIL